MRERVDDSVRIAPDSVAIYTQIPSITHPPGTAVRSQPFKQAFSIDEFEVTPTRSSDFLHAGASKREFVTEPLCVV
jgi:hypothetical protein